jgi:hypothetical protein
MEKMSVDDANEIDEKVSNCIPLNPSDEVIHNIINK